MLQIKQYYPYIIILFIAIFTLWIQNTNVGFGYDNHGFVSSHALAIINRANLDNYLVGYTLQFKNNLNEISYYYFDRYPIVINSLSKIFLSNWDNDIPQKVYYARQLMNFFFILTFIISYLLLNKLSRSKIISLTAVLFSFSSFHILYYKDMTNIDQTALLGILFLLLGITYYKLDNRKILLIISAVISVSLGFGYASILVLAIWFVLEAASTMKNSSSLSLLTFSEIGKHISFKTLIVGILLGSSFLFYNTYIESKKTNTHLSQVSIVKSAKKRLSLSKKFNIQKKHREKVSFRPFIKQQVNRIAELTTPVFKENNETRNISIIIAILIFIPLYLLKQDRNNQTILLILISFGCLFLTLLRSYAAFHNFTSIYYIGIPLVFYLSIFSIFKKYRLIPILFLLLGLIVYCYTNLEVTKKRNIISEIPNKQTYDFVRISKLIEPDANIFIHGGYRKLIKRSPYAVAFYLPNQYITSKENADYIISLNRNYHENLLTPDNDYIYLFKKK